MTNQFIEINPGYLIAISSIQAVQWEDDKLRILYDKAGASTTADVADIRGSARYLYERIRKLAITFETGPEFEAEEV